MNSKTVIKVFGIGGAGNNAVDRMVQAKIRGVDLIAVNTDAQDLKKVRAHQKIRIGRESTKGLGAGMNPELGKKAALESREELLQALQGADMVFLAAGLGGGTGGGAIVPIAEMAKAQKILSVAVVTKPFSFEGSWRNKLAQKAMLELQGKVDTLLVIENDQILELIEPGTTVLSAFWSADEILRQAVQGISDLIVIPGIINVDFADVRSIMSSAGQAVFGMGRAKGEQRIEQALEAALHSPLLNMSIQGANGVLFNIAGGDTLTLAEVNEAAQKIREKLAPEATIIFGTVYDKGLKAGEVKITLIATGFKKGIFS
ncbi:MAG: cell division protein FtsZ [Candidatus Wildermuthbacteria bacterium RIFCSPHIGHO2_02_FULL_49_9]|uniref:Cell division protein FtsZ n=2 Tax=Candidatus Wildermuthiibacteriota TaxID=1817923 RepID=A0A1G2QWM1_9BACT|nr:MAG: cell division protein FtsZ [Candidatus Wildermuthbacteria bacterium RIFCSPHIGHO2_01_FULL_49_22b]OHA71195.1 MAG: cell division protein FtsZ [Candidatus Wildermuthbacteria bacterium RIFCSPHIGHO2_02_FULL_49_9]